jgi:hypothetical protein
MRFLYIDRQKIRPVLVVLIDFRDPLDRASKGRSSVASENQNQRFAIDITLKMQASLAVKGGQDDVGGSVADYQITFGSLVVEQETNNIPETHPVDHYTANHERNQREN